MPVETGSMFAQVIQDHLELKQRNSQLEGKLPLGRYRAEDPFENHPLFKTEEQARLEETMDGEVTAHAVVEPLGWAGEQVEESSDENLWSRSRDFDWGD